MNSEPCFQPINGISLERYAELGAAIADAKDDRAKIAEIIKGEGVALADWDAAKTGWTARMQDMKLMGRVATAFMPLYRAALAKKRGGTKASTSYEDFVAASAAIKVFGFAVGLEACGVSSTDWTEVAGHWTQQMSARMMEFAGHADAIAREEARIRAGGKPKAIEVKRVAASAERVERVERVDAYAATLPSTGHLHAMNPMSQGVGFALGLQQVGAFLSGGVVPGAQVFVIHPSNQQRYQARVLSTMPDQTLVQFPNGAQQWVPAAAVQRA